MRRRESMPRILYHLCWGLFLILGQDAAHAQSAQGIAKKAFSSTVLLVMEDANGQPISLGSGFLVRAGEIATNLHVVQGAARGYAKLVGQQAKYNIEGITGVDPERDLVVLKISAVLPLAGTDGVFYGRYAKSSASPQMLALGDSDGVQVGEVVYAVGNPQGLEGTFSQGILSGIRSIGPDRLLQITAPISPGSSGGPVLNAKGEVIGVSAAAFMEGQNLNFAIPSNYLQTLLARTGQAKPFATGQTPKTRRSILANFGGRSSEGVVAGQFTWRYLAGGDYAFSLRNQLREDVKKVYCLVVFYDARGNPIDVDAVQYPGSIPPGLAKRVTSKVDTSVQDLTTPTGSMTPKTKVEFRILDFQIAH